MRVNLRWVVTGGLVLLVGMAGSPGLRSQGLMDFEVSIFGGGSFITDGNFQVGEPQFAPPLYPEPVPFTYSVESSARGGMRVNFLTANKWGTELYYSYSSRTSSLVRPGEDPLLLPINTHGIGVSFLYYPFGNGYPLATSGRLTPFLTGGIGAAIFRPTSEAKENANDVVNSGIDEDIRESSEVAYSYGGGVKYRLNRIFGVRADFRGYFSNNPSFGLPRESGDPAQPIIPKVTIHDTEVSVGIMINFGSRP